MSEADCFDVVSRSSEFENVQAREEENQVSLGRCVDKCCLSSSLVNLSTECCLSSSSVNKVECGVGSLSAVCLVVSATAVVVLSWMSQRKLVLSRDYGTELYESKYACTTESWTSLYRVVGRLVLSRGHVCTRSC